MPECPADPDTIRIESIDGVIGSGNIHHISGAYARHADARDYQWLCIDLVIQGVGKQLPKAPCLYILDIQLCLLAVPACPVEIVMLREHVNLCVCSNSTECQSYAQHQCALFHTV